MIRRSTAAAAALAALFTANVANAASSTEPVARPVSKDPAATAVGSSLGTPFVVRQGLYVDGQLGVFTAFGGAAGASNAQPYVGLQIGYDIPGVKRLSLFLGAGMGTNDGSCHYYTKVTGGVPVVAPASVTGSGNQCYTYAASATTFPEAPHDFQVIPIEVGARYGFADMIPALLPNFFPYVMAVGGYTLYTPALTRNGATGSGHVGVGGGVEFGTRLAGFSFGVEALVRLAFVPSAPVPDEMVSEGASATSSTLPILPSLSIYPRFQYVF
jgi:hypothetical protein